jgi:heme-degrading monooxygenase HmoA
MADVKHNEPSKNPAMMVIAFRARRTPEGLGDEYQYWFKRMSEIAVTMPGYISHKGYVAEESERLSLFEWESAESLKAWAQHPEHVPTKQLARKVLLGLSPSGLRSGAGIEVYE